MNETLADRIRERISDLGLTVDGAATVSGLDRSTVRKILERQGGVRSDTIVKLARGLQTTEEWLLRAEGNKEGAARLSEVKPAQPSPPSKQPATDLPVYGLAAGSITGALTMTNEPIDYRNAPPALSRVRDAYALIVTGSSMEPRYEAGDYIYVDPHRPPRQGDHVVIQEFRHGGTVVSIKRFERLTETHIVTSQYNPLAEVKFLRGPEVIMHRVLTHNEASGNG